MTRMSGAEALMWVVDKDPALRSDFCNLTIVDGVFDDERLRAKVARAVAAIPRLHQKVVTPPLRLAAPDWVDDPDFDLDYHVRRVAVPGKGTMRELLDAVAVLAETPFDRARPLWEFTVFDGLEGDRSALLQRMHHTITDGVGGMRLSLEIVDLTPDGDLDAAAAGKHTDASATNEAVDADAIDPPRAATPLDVTRAALADAAARPVRAARTAAGGVARAVTNPLQVPSGVGGAFAAMSSLRRQVLLTEQARSDVMAERSLARWYGTLTVELPPLAAAARALGGSLNDAFVTAVCGALGRYHAARGSSVAELRMAMPINTRQQGDRAANRFTPSRVLVPIQPVADVRARFARVHERLDATKRDAALGATDALAGVTATLPTAVLVALARSQTRTIDFATSNLRGSPVPLHLAGPRIVASYPFGPRAGCALNVTLMSYCDELHVGLNVDPVAVTEPDQLLAELHDAFAAVAGSPQLRACG
jgi:WS/DGAT/MGAT family acyltransferase